MDSILDEKTSVKNNITEDFKEIPLKNFLWNNLNIPYILYMCSMLSGEKMNISEEKNNKNEFSSGWKKINKDSTKTEVNASLKNLEENVEKFKSELLVLTNQKNEQTEILNEKILKLENNLFSISNEIKEIHNVVLKQNEEVLTIMSALNKLLDIVIVGTEASNKGSIKDILFRKK